MYNSTDASRDSAADTARDSPDGNNVGLLAYT